MATAARVFPRVPRCFGSSAPNGYPGHRAVPPSSVLTRFPAYALVRTADIDRRFRCSCRGWGVDARGYICPLSEAEAIPRSGRKIERADWRTHHLDRRAIRYRKVTTHITVRD